MIEKSDISTVFQQNDAVPSLLFPSIGFSSFRNIFPYNIPLGRTAHGLRIHIEDDTEQTIHFNGLRLWVRCEGEAQIRPYNGPYHCTASSHHAYYSDLSLPLTQAKSTQVAFHNLPESHPWWEMRFEEPLFLSHLQFKNRLDNHGKRSLKLSFSTLDEKGAITGTYRIKNPDDSPTPAYIEAEITARLRQCDEWISKTYLPILSEWEALKIQFARYMTCVKSDRPLIKEALLEQFRQIFDSLNSKGYYEYGAKPSEAWRLNQKDYGPQKARYIKLVVWSSSGARGSILNLAYRDSSGAFCQKHYDNIIFKNRSRDAALITQGQQAGIHAAPYEFIADLGSAQEIIEIKLWGGGPLERSRMLTRALYSSEDGENWTMMGSSFAEFSFLSQLAFLWSYLLPTGINAGLAKRLGVFYTRFRRENLSLLINLIKKDKNAILPTLEDIRLMGKKTNHLAIVMYTKHGLRSSLATANPERLVGLMDSFAKALEERLGYQAFPCYGTLLGIRRNNGFIPHDDDIDWGLVIPMQTGDDLYETRDRVIAKFQAAGFEVKPANKDSLNIHCRWQDIVMDIFLFCGPGPMVKCHMEKYLIRDVRLELLSPLTTLNFLGRVFHAPADIDGFLLDRYGPGWVKPDPAYEL